ncbi:response regulator transcription factor [bacterium SCSIO 12741]|nr:response regulator transcription factor [bacterium SCSIO 12741]
MKTSEFKVLIVDDEAPARDMMELLIQNHFPEIGQVQKANGVEMAKEVLNQFDPDLIFLDVEMGDQSGFELLDQIQAKSCQVIFVTAHDQYAIRALRASAVDYLLKPVVLEDFKRAVNKALKHSVAPTSEIIPADLKGLMSQMNQKELTKIGVPDIHGLQMVEIDDIVRCKADDNYTYLYLKDGNRITASRSLSHYEKELKNHGFLRVHHRHLVNLNYIVRYQKGKGGGELEMRDHSCVEVSTRKKPELMKVLRV